MKIWEDRGGEKKKEKKRERIIQRKREDIQMVREEEK